MSEFSEILSDSAREAEIDLLNLIRLDAIKARDKDWEAWGIIEISVRNPSVAEYMRHWESRAAKAEEDADFLRKSVGAVHMMISRNDLAELDGKWESTDLPPRLKKFIRGTGKALDWIDARIRDMTSLPVLGAISEETWQRSAGALEVLRELQGYLQK